MSDNTTSPLGAAAGTSGSEGAAPPRSTESTHTLVNGMGGLSTMDRDPSPGPSSSNVRITLDNDTNKRKRTNTGPAGQAPKRGRPNIPQEVERLYKQARNSRTRAAKYQANETMLRKYLGHNEHLAPNNMRVRTVPPFGADDPTVQKQWADIIEVAEKSMLDCQATYLRSLIASEEAKAELALSQVKAQLGPNISAFEEADAASVAVATRVRAAEIQKLRYRWVHDVQRHETQKIGLPISPKGKGRGKKTPPKGKAPNQQEATTSRRTSKGKRRLPRSNDAGNQGTSGAGAPQRPGTSRPPRGNPDDNLFRMFAELLNNRI